MKILVYGAGVLGSYLAHVLHRGGNDVTLLARGKRLQELQQHGLVIRHYIQRRTTTDVVKLTERLDAQDQYDIVFVVVQRTQLDDILPHLCTNENSALFVFVGNNPTASETLRFIRGHSQKPKNVVFGFQSSGGRRENGKIISIHIGISKLAGSMTVGSLDSNPASIALLQQAFAATHYKLNENSNMDAWLKCHVAFIMPIAFACYYSAGDLRKIAWDSRFLNKVIDCMDEAYQMVEACGYPIEPKGDQDFVRRQRFKCFLMLRVLAATPIGKLACSDHAMAAQGEMKRLYDDFCVLKKQARIATPAWDELAQYMVK